MIAPPGRAGVRELEAGGRRLHDVARDRERQPARAARLEQLAQARAIDELHDEEHVLAIAREVHDAHDVAVLQADEELRLADQPLDKHVVVRELGKQALDRDRLLKSVRAMRVAREHLGHTAATEQLAQDVTSLAARLSRRA